MNRTITRRTVSLLLALLLALPFAVLAEETEEEYPEETAAETETEASGEVTEKDGWHFDSRGFLVGDDNPGEAYLLEDEEGGAWQYASRDLSVKVTRFTEKYNKKKKLEYCVAEIWASENSPMRAILSAPKGTLPEGANQVSPELLAEKHPCVFAMSDDMYGQRQLNLIKKTGNRQPGIIIRNGEVRWDKTKSTASKAARQRPCLDTMAVYSDGSAKTYVSDAKTAEEYLAEGAQQVFAFGPWLISEGKINEKEAVEGCGYYEQNEPLCALGMVEPYHYIAILVRAWPKAQYTGVKLSWMAEKLQEYGCTEALNLDGGGTACMMFNGKVIIHGRDGLRSIGGMIAFGEGAAAEATAVSGGGENEKKAAEAETVKAKVNLREETDKGSGLVATVAKKGTAVTVLDEEYDGDGVLWYLVRTEDGKEGYVRNDMLRMSNE